MYPNISRGQAGLAALRFCRLRWARSVVRAEDGCGRLSKPRVLRLRGPAAAAPGPAHRVSRAKMKNLKNSSQKIKKNKPRAPPPDLFWVRLLFWQNDWGRSQEPRPNSRILKPSGLSSWTPGAPHLYTLETSYPARRRRPAHANTTSAEHPRKQQHGNHQRSEQEQTGVHQTHILSRCCSPVLRDRPAWQDAQSTSEVGSRDRFFVLQRRTVSVNQTRGGPVFPTHPRAPGDRR